MASESDRAGLVAVNHTGFTVADIERSIVFYRDVLGLTLLGRQEGQRPYLATITGFADVYLKTAWLAVALGAGHVLELLEYTSHPAPATPRETNRPGNGHLCFQVTDIQAVYERLAAHGVGFISPPAPVTSGANAGAIGCYLRDPDGFTLELFQSPGIGARR
ncbi:MAG: VOC family protein [Chloroflexi bacterium]|nr:VOC family protein [Chloroflexota bacterium]